MSLLDRNGEKPDVFSREAAVGENVIVPLADLPAAIAARVQGQLIGVDVPNTTPIAVLTPLIGDLALIAITFPKFSDGRGFSLAKMLREAGFSGTLRATGSLIPDQFAFALQCGFDEVEIADERVGRQPIAQWLRAPTEIAASYQASYRASYRDGAPVGASIFARRAAARRDTKVDA